MRVRGPDPAPCVVEDGHARAQPRDLVAAEAAILNYSPDS